MKTKGFWVLRVLKFVVLGAAFVVLAGFAVMALWNWLMPAIFGLGSITWLQALGLLALAKILFGMGGHRGGGWGGRHSHRCGSHRGHWRAKWEQKWEQMSDAEKAAMRAKWGNRCGYGSCSPEDKPREEDKAAG